MSLTSTEKSKARRKRLAEAGLKELRAVYVSDEEEKALKPQIKKILDKMRKK